MSIICLVGRMPEAWQARILAEAPRLALERQPEGSAVAGPQEGAEGAESRVGARVWVDGRGMRAEELARRLAGVLGDAGGEVRGGVAGVPVAAWAAAWQTAAEDVAIVRAGAERTFLKALPLAVLELDAKVRELLEGAGVETCGELAALPREAVEVRFGPEAVRAWRRSRADDDRRLFWRPPPEPPHAGLDFVDYVVTDPERLVFTANALLGPLCDGMVARGSHARQVTLSLPLANGAVWQRTVRSARPTASRSTWLRLLRGVLERLSVPDAVAGIELRIDATEAAHAIQGDLFDAGFGTAAGVEAALTRVLEVRDSCLVRPEPAAHPLAEQRSRFTAEVDVLEASGVRPSSPAGSRRRSSRRRAAGAVSSAGVDAERSEGPPETGSAAWGQADPAGLTLQLLLEARPIQVETVERRDHGIPVRYRDRRWRTLVTAVGPERVSGGQWEEVYAREYYRCVTADGLLVWIYRDGVRGGWWLHGWWD